MSINLVCYLIHLESSHHTAGSCSCPVCLRTSSMMANRASVSACDISGHSNFPVEKENRNNMVSTDEKKPNCDELREKGTDLTQSFDKKIQKAEWQRKGAILTLITQQ